MLMSRVPRTKRSARKKKRIFLFIGKVRDLKKAIAPEMDAEYGII